VFRRVWTADPPAQLNNPLGGILRVTVTLGGIVEYDGGGHAVFAGRETGEYRVGDSPAVP
jgi:hypothetical protein